jgi:hypothetical protein
MGWQDDFKLRNDLRQRDIVEFELSLNKRKVIISASSVTAESALCSAIDAGWVVSPKTEAGEFDGERRYYYDGQDVRDMSAGMVRWLGSQITVAYNKAVEIPPN